eukprot:Clim_evm27s214 gene=Clim_evmTU27s214
MPLSWGSLVIGTLYCSKGNYEFGINRIMKSLEPCNTKLSAETCFYAKQAFLSLIENMNKHMIILKDEVLQEIFIFLNACQVCGLKDTCNTQLDTDGGVAKDESAVVEIAKPRPGAMSTSAAIGTGKSTIADPSSNNVAFEARMT